MNGTDIGTIAANILTYFGGAAGGYIAAASLMVVWILCGMHVLSPRHGVTTIVVLCLAWGAAYMIRTTLGWA